MKLDKIESKKNNRISNNIKEETLLIYLYFIKKYINSNSIIVPKNVKHNVDIIFKKQRIFILRIN